MIFVFGVTASVLQDMEGTKQAIYESAGEPSCITQFGRFAKPSCILHLASCILHLASGSTNALVRELCQIAPSPLWTGFLAI